MYRSGSQIAAPQYSLMRWCGHGKEYSKRRRRIAIFRLPSVLLLLAAGLFVKIGVAAQLVHHLH
jgi:hypothetical protein